MCVNVRSFVCRRSCVGDGDEGERASTPLDQCVCVCVCRSISLDARVASTLLLRSSCSRAALLPCCAESSLWPRCLRLAWISRGHMLSQTIVLQLLLLQQVVSGRSWPMQWPVVDEGVCWPAGGGGCEAGRCRHPAGYWGSGGDGRMNTNQQLLLASIHTSLCVCTRLSVCLCMRA